jgi:hypothetical protein
MHQVAFLLRDRDIGRWQPLLGSTAPILEILRKFPANVDKNISPIYTKSPANGNFSLGADRGVLVQSTRAGAPLQGNAVILDRYPSPLGKSHQTNDHFLRDTTKDKKWLVLVGRPSLAAYRGRARRPAPPSYFHIKSGDHTGNFLL